MSTFAEAHHELVRCLKARTPLIVIRTFERKAAEELVRDCTAELGLTALACDSAKGVVDLGTQSVLSSDRSFYSALSFFTESFAKRVNLVAVLEDTPDISDDCDASRKLLGTVEFAEETSSSVVVITDGDVWAPLRRMSLSVDLDVPNEAEALAIIQDIIKRNEIQLDRIWGESDQRRAASIVVGLSRPEIRNAMAALVANGALQPEDLDYLRQVKDSRFRDSAGLEKVRVADRAATVEGLDGLRAWLEENGRLFQPEMRERLREECGGLRPPRGILLTGVPGCGKSLSARYVAQQWDMPLYRLDFATVQSKWVGEGPERLAYALKSAETAAPCILWIDEIEKGLGGYDTTRATQELLGMFLFWLQESDAPVFVLATANDITLMPPELLRKGRFTEIFFIDLPSAPEREAILRLHMRNYLKIDFAGDLADRIVEMTEGFSGAELESIASSLARKQISSGIVLTEDVFMDAVRSVVPQAVSRADQIAVIREWGAANGIPAS